jgi:hydrogenase maturation protein HypF
MRTEFGVPATSVRVRLDITGVVQGVGFRPAVARIANAHGVGGFVYNDAGAVHCELEGPAAAVDAAAADIRDAPPPMARIDGVCLTMIAPQGDASFRIVASKSCDDSRTLVPPDIAMCEDCLRDMRDPGDRRYRHPFITCTNCGPRYTLITDLPYDRSTTTMAGFPMCSRCLTEYHDPADRRFNAQTIACPDCGPVLSWSGPDERNQFGDGDPISAAAAAIDAGFIVAVKGIGGYHLACRADDPAVLAKLRRRKSRPAKPFAVMTADLAGARRIAEVSDGAEAALTSSSAPIVLLPALPGGLAPQVAPGLREVGVMLAYSPVHHLLFDRLAATALVMTSANQGGSPIVFRDDDLHWIDHLADAVLSHDRPIHVPCEDSVVAIDREGEQLPIRRSRGYAPLPVAVSVPHDAGVILAPGGDLKTTFCLMSDDGRAYMSSHLGDMADPRTQACFDDAYRHLAFMTDRRPKLIAHDLHPGYATTRWAARQGLDLFGVQHHHAHAVSLIAEHRRIGEPVLAVAYDGTGYGTDGTIWGGELLAITDPASFTRAGHLKPFALPGGDEAARQPARIALDLLYRAGIGWGADLAPVAEIGPAGMKVLAQQIPRGMRCVATSSMGRLFDAVASLLGVCQRVGYEGQAAIELEHVARGGSPRALELEFGMDAGLLDPMPVMAGIVDGLRSGAEIADLAAAFHDAVVRATVAAAASCAGAAGIGTIGLTGGVFVNRLLLDGIRKTLSDHGFEVLTHRILPCNDGGLALGQAVIAACAHPSKERSDPCALVSPAR